MSSEIEGTGLIVAAVALPAVAAFGAGWLAWQGGKLLLEANAAVDRNIAEKKRQLAEAEKQRKATAIAAHEQMAAMCRNVLTELDGLGGTESEILRAELRQIGTEHLPDDAAQIESINAAGLTQLERIVNRQKRLRDIKIFGSGVYDGLAMADLMDDLRLAILTAEIMETTGTDVKAADPLVLERAGLNRRLSEVSARVMTALEFVVDMAQNYGMSEANNAWFQSCFNDADRKIAALCSPAVSNRELKKGIRALEDIMEQYDMLYPNLAKEKQKMSALYRVYTDAARALGEPVRQLRHFKSAAALEEELKYLQKRSERAKKCAGIYQKLGPAAYLCYAWDEELRAQGYSVHTRRRISEMAGRKPERARLGEAAMPFYQWSEGALTQLYSIAPECSLQLVVHPDGTITMQTIAEQGDSERAVAAQKAHCASIKAIHQKLRENWFICYDYQQTLPAESIYSLEAWRGCEEHTWTRSAAVPEAAGVRENAREESQKVMRKE